MNTIRPNQAAPISSTRPQAAAQAQAQPQDRFDAAPADKPQYEPGQVLVKFKSDVGLANAQSLAADMGLSTIRHFDVPESMQKSFGGELFQFALQEGETVEQAVARLSGQEGVAYAEPNYKIQVQAEPNDLDSRLWGLKNTGNPGVDVAAPAAWDLTTGAPNGQGPLIAVIDTGIDYNHPDLAANVWTNPGEIPGDGIDNDGNGYIDDVHGANMINGGGDPLDDNRHGTHCAGTIGAKGDNGEGVVGVNWNATMAGVKFLDGGGGGTYADAIEAVIYSGRIGARVTSNSWGGGGGSEALKDAFRSNPALHICAAGNSGQNADQRPHFPSGFDLDNIVSVAAHDRTDKLARFSNYGARSVDVAAPGVDIYSTLPNGQYGSLSGTSMATPHVSGVVGLMLSNNPELTNEQIKSRLINTAVKGAAYEGKMVAGGRVSAINTMETDETPPAAPADLHVAGLGATSITLGFTATGDDGHTGQAASYQVRVSDKPITENGDQGVSWDQATPMSGLSAPGAAGSPEMLTLPVPTSEEPKTYFFAVKVADNMGNTSPMVTAAARAKAAAFAFSDDMEQESENWAPDAGWGKVAVEGRGMVYTDSPEGSYGANASTSLTSRALDLSTVKNPRLSYNMKLDTEAGYDRVHVEMTEDGGQTWSELASYDGTEDWKNYEHDMSAHEGKTIQVRFRLSSDGSLQKDGVYVDDVKVAGDPREC